MNIKIANKFALKNLKAHSLIYLPFVLSSGIMLMLLISWQALLTMNL